MSCCRETISKEPFCPAVRQGDDRWFNLVKWTQFRSARRRGAGRDLEQCRGDEKDPTIRKSAACSGVEGDYGAGLGLTPDWAARIVKAVGNYGEIFERNLGKEFALENSARPQRLVARRRAALRPAGAMRRAAAFAATHRDSGRAAARARRPVRVRLRQRPSQSRTRAAFRPPSPFCTMSPASASTRA